MAPVQPHHACGTRTTMKPCKSCPFLPESQLGLWSAAHYLLIAYLGSVRDFVEGAVETSMGCHQHNGILRPAPAKPPRCGGWLRAARDSYGLTIRSRLGMLDAAERAEMNDAIFVLSPEDMARLNGLDMSRLPPLAAPIGKYAEWRAEVEALKQRLREDPSYADTFVLPGSPLALGVTADQIEAALGSRAADLYDSRCSPASR